MTPQVSLTMIVKNEAGTLGRCLGSVYDIVNEIIVVDTGSSDNTKDIAVKHGARVFDLPWPDSFAVARNESIRFASGQWLLWLDADEYFDDANCDKLRHLLASLSDSGAAYVMKCLCMSGLSGISATAVDHVRLFRNHPAIRWDYRVHEQLLPAIHRAGHAVRFTDIAINHTGYTDPALRHKKLERNLRLLHLDLSERPNDPFTLFNLGWAFADLGRCNESIPLFQRSLQLAHPAESIMPKLYVLLALCHRRMGELTEAWRVCHAGQVRYPDDPELLFFKGQLCYQRGDRSSARACWEHLLNDAAYTQHLPWVGFDVDGRQVLADTPYPQILSSAPSGNQTITYPLPQFLGRREPSKMEGVFRSIDAGLHGTMVRYHLAVLDREEGHLADSEKHLRTILDEAPDYHPARLGLAELYLYQERWPVLETILAELEPHAPLDTAILRARKNLARRDFAAARQLLEDTIRLAPHHLPAHVTLSHVLLQSGDESAAGPQLCRIVEMDPRQSDSWQNLTVLYRRQNRLHEAIAVAKAGCLHCPHDAYLLLLQGALLHEGGDAINAETCLFRVLEMADNNSAGHELRTRARYELARIYRKIGRFREAVAHLRALLAESQDLLPRKTFSLNARQNGALSVDGRRRKGSGLVVRGDRCAG